MVYLPVIYWDMRTPFRRSWQLCRPPVITHTVSVLNQNALVLVAVCSKYYGTDVGNTTECIKQNIWTAYCDTVVFWCVLCIYVCFCVFVLYVAYVNVVAALRRKKYYIQTVIPSLSEWQRLQSWVGHAGWRRHWLIRSGCTGTDSIGLVCRRSHPADCKQARDSY